MGGAVQAGWKKEQSGRVPVKKKNGKSMKTECPPKVSEPGTGWEQKKSREKSNSEIRPTKWAPCKTDKRVRWALEKKNVPEGERRPSKPKRGYGPSNGAFQANEKENRPPVRGADLRWGRTVRGWVTGTVQ